VACAAVESDLPDFAVAVLKALFAGRSAAPGEYTVEVLVASDLVGLPVLALVALPALVLVELSEWFFGSFRVTFFAGGWQANVLFPAGAAS